MYEIIQSINSKENLQSDFDDIQMLLSAHFRKKYVEKLENAFKRYQKDNEKNPSNEVKLLNALKPYIPSEKRGDIDNITEMLTFISTFENIRKEAGAALPKTAASAIHEDGIYEVDEECLRQQHTELVEPPQNINAAQLMLVMGLMSGMGKGGVL